MTTAITRSDSNEGNLPPIEETSGEAPGRLKFSLSDLVQGAHHVPNETNLPDFDELENWLESAQSQLKRQYASRVKPVSVEGNKIRVNESAIMLDTLYTVKLEDYTYQIVFTSDGRIEVYEVAD